MKIIYHSKTLLTAIIMSLSIALLPINTAIAALTQDNCEQAITAANDIYKAALRNPDYPTKADAKEVADKHFAKQVGAQIKAKYTTRSEGVDACALHTNPSVRYYNSLFTY